MSCELGDLTTFWFSYCNSEFFFPMLHISWGKIEIEVNLLFHIQRRLIFFQTVSYRPCPPVHDNICCLFGPNAEFEWAPIKGSIKSRSVCLFLCLCLSLPVYVSVCLSLSFSLWWSMFWPIKRRFRFGAKWDWVRVRESVCVWERDRERQTDRQRQTDIQT